MSLWAGGACLLASAVLTTALPAAAVAAPAPSKQAERSVAAKLVRDGLARPRVACSRVRTRRPAWRCGWVAVTSHARCTGVVRVLRRGWRTGRLTRRCRPTVQARRAGVTAWTAPLGAVLRPGTPAADAPATPSRPAGPPAPPPPPPPAPPPPPQAPRAPDTAPTVDAELFGVNGQFLVPTTRAVAWEPHLDRIAATGVRHVRSDALWSIAEPRAPVRGVHTYRWEHFDAIVEALALRGLRWYPIVDYAPSWNRVVKGNTLSPPAELSSFAAYARALAARYGAGGDFWREHPGLPVLDVRALEIWNEPNWPTYWRPGPDPAAYADLYLQAREAIHEVLPQAVVVSGGLSQGGDPARFVRAMYAARPDLRGRHDALGLHPYGRTPADVVAAIAATREVLDAAGGTAAVPIEVTEVGWATSGYGWAIPDATRATYLAELARSVTAPELRVTRFLPHTWVTAERDPTKAEDWYGLAAPDGAQTASTAALGSAVRALVGD